MQLVTNFWRFKLRTFKWDDLYAMQALINVIAQYDHVPYYYSLEWLHYTLSQPDISAERDCFVATLDNERIVGYSQLESGDDPTRQVILAGVHPDYRGIGIGRGLIAINDFNLLANTPKRSSLIACRRSVRHAHNLLTRAGYQHTTTDEHDHLLWEKSLY